MSELKLVKELLNFDPVDTAEKICKDQDDSGPLAFALNMSKGAMLKKLLKGFDTYFGSTFQETVDILKSIGFNLEYEEHFKNDRNQIETFQIYVHEHYTMFVNVESCDEISLNRCTVHFLVRRPTTKEEWDQFLSIHMSHDSWDEYDREKKETIEKQEIICELDGREAIKIRLSELKDFLSTNPIPREPFLWLLNYVEEKDERNTDLAKNGYRQRSLKKLLKCKSHKRIIGWELPKKSLFQRIKEKF